jgi:transmembrane sensor
MSDLPPGSPAGPVPSDPDRPGAAPVGGRVGAPPDVPSWDAVARVWAGEPARAPNDGAADVARDVAARRWLAEHPHEAARLAALGGVVAASLGAGAAADAPPVDVEAALARVTQRRRGDAAPSTRRPSAPRAPAWAARPARRRALVAVAAALGVVGIGVGRRRTAPAGGEPGTVALTAASQRHQTAVGRRDSVRLPDGTRVLLAPGTTVEVVAGYGAATRTVALTGEAYFDVVHDDARPFRVVAGPAVVHDIGTRFAVRHDAADRIAVTVTEGAVRVAAVDATAPPVAVPVQPARPRPAPGAPTAAPSFNPADSGLVLRAGERGLVTRDPRLGVTVARLPGAAARAADDTAWTSGRLVFRDAPISEVSASLRRWYGVELRTTDRATASRHLTATFRGEPLPEVLRVVGLALGARLDRRGDTVLVHPAR